MDLGWLEQLGTTGAATLVQAAATEAWQTARTGFVRLFGRNDRAREVTAERRLDALAAQVEQAPPEEREQLRQRLLPAWQTRLADLIEEDPAAADALRTLRDELLARLPAPRQQWIQQYITATAPGAYASGAVLGNVINHAVPTATGPATAAVQPGEPATGEVPPR